VRPSNRIALDPSTHLMITFWSNRSENPVWNLRSCYSFCTENFKGGMVRPFMSSSCDSWPMGSWKFLMSSRWMLLTYPCNTAEHHDSTTFLVDLTFLIWAAGVNGGLCSFYRINHSLWLNFLLFVLQPGMR
jgi:hypothetical protein